MNFLSRTLALWIALGLFFGGMGSGVFLWGGEQPPAPEQSSKTEKPSQPAPEAKPAEKPKSEPPSPSPKQPAVKEPVSKETPKPAPSETPSAKPTPSTEKPPEKPATITMAPKPFKIEVTLEGYFEARDTQEVILKPEVWMDWEVLSAVKHGAQVRQGDVLIQFDSKKLTDAVTEAKADLRLAEITLQLAQLDAQLAESMTPIDLALLERSQKRFAEEYDRFFKVQLPMARKNADFMLRIAQYYLESTQEELRQLEKMYQADDLTEETEEFILKRQRLMVELATFEYETAQKNHEETTQLRLPWQEEDRKTDEQVHRLRTDRAKTALPLLLQKTKTELEKAQLARTKAQEKLDQLQTDLALMTLKAPTEGIVYYGRLTAGRLTGTEGEPLRKGDKVQPNRPVMTILKTRPMVLVAEVPEEKFYAVRTGVQAKVEPKALPELKLSAVVAEMDRVPVADGKFRARLTPILDKQADALMPGMGCKVKLVPYVKPDALVVPKSAVEEDPLDEEKAYVYLVVEGKEPQRHPVVRGRQKENDCEILSGLKPGDKILEKPPKKKQDEP